MKSYLSLIPISAKVHRRQSRMTRICIILAVFLVTSIFSMAEMWTESETTVMRQNHGDWHISLQNVPDDKAEQIIVNSDVAFSSWYDAINVDADKGYYIGGKNVTLYGVEETYPARIMNYPTEGSYFTSAGLQEYIAKCTHRAKPAEKNATYRKPRRAGV